ncbi:MAG: histidinol-phosphate aminotransferase family protein [Chloroflexaceae bacterium]|nr:histidinol-phosphate aminotransferase family protein [Chloroflexaceae bacterium]
MPIDQHPDPRATPLRRLLAQREGLAPEMVLVGNGAVDLIYQLVTAFVRPGDTVLTLAPTFGEYAAAATMMGANVIAHQTRAEQGFQPDLDQLIEQVQQSRPRICFLCNPNNPTGVYLPRDSIAALLNACPKTLLVLDEAFVNFAADPWPARELLPAGNLAILRSLTKDYALTALRAGYVLAPPLVIDALAKVQPPWSVNALAQAAALVALEDEQHLVTSMVALAQARTSLVRQLVTRGLHPLDSAVHFFLLPVPSANAWAQQLRQHGIIVRDGTSFGLPMHIRIAPRHAEANARLVHQLAAQLSLKPT